jgi:prepilin-type N-terminal cleavage/methylation domain-containing protein
MRYKNGLTIIELIITVAIMLIIAAILIPTASMFIRRANEAADLANARMLYNASLIALAECSSINPGEYSSIDVDASPVELRKYLGGIWPKPLQKNMTCFIVEIAKNDVPSSCVNVYRATISGREYYNPQLNQFN